MQSLGPDVLHCCCLDLQGWIQVLTGIEIEQLRNKNARLAAIESMLARFEPEHLSGSNPLASTGDSLPS
jgi:hypothetical protein